MTRPSITTAPIRINVMNDIEQQIVAAVAYLAPMGIIWIDSERNQTVMIIKDSTMDTANRMRMNSSVQVYETSVYTKFPRADNSHVLFPVRLYRN
jgi:hypothetical protein